MLPLKIVSATETSYKTASTQRFVSSGFKNSVSVKKLKIVYIYDLVLISPAYGANTYQIMYVETFDFIYCKLELFNH